MIFSAFVYLGAFILQGIVAVLPTSSGFPPELASAFTTMSGYVQILDTLLPVSTLATVLGILISVDVAIFGFKSFKWVISYIPFVGGRG